MTKKMTLVRPDNELNSHELLERIVVERLEKTNYNYGRVLGNLQGVLEAILVDNPKYIEKVKLLRKLS